MQYHKKVVIFCEYLLRYVYLISLRTFSFQKNINQYSSKTFQIKLKSCLYENPKYYCVHSQSWNHMRLLLPSRYIVPFSPRRDIAIVASWYFVLIIGFAMSRQEPHWEFQTLGSWLQSLPRNYYVCNISHVLIMDLLFCIPNEFFLCSLYWYRFVNLEKIWLQIKEFHCNVQRGYCNKCLCKYCSLLCKLLQNSAMFKRQ